MKHIILSFILVLIINVNGVFAQQRDGKIFESYRELGEYAFGNTDLNSVTNGYLFDYAFGF